MKTCFLFLRNQRNRIAPATIFLLALSAVSQAQVVIPKSPQIGSSNPVSPEPPVARPSTKPCTVQLFKNLEFADFSSKSFNYTPPGACPGPWAKVIFTADFTVTAGIQYDRTAEFFLGHANIFYGTTAEPSPTLSPSWHVERDLTDLSKLFRTPQTGEADLGNLVNSTYTGIIYANAALLFYPASRLNPAAAVPDLVVPLPDAPGGAVGLGTTASQLTQTVTLPTNVERVYLDVIAQSQSNDEFWYTCVPNDVTGPLESCGNTAFRETEVSIDGIPAGVAPVYPWIYTGGLDPYLWIPLPGIQTLDFKPYRVDLTPFAGLLSDGDAHTVAISVFNADSYFLATANLLVYTDHGKDVVTGGILANTLTAAPVPTVHEQLNLDSSGNGTATVTVGSKRNFTISGYVNTSQGKVTTTVEQNVQFLSTQNFTLSDSAYIQAINQSTTVDSVTTTKTPFGTQVGEGHISYPFNLTYNYTVNADGSAVQTVTSDQQNQYQLAPPQSPFTFGTEEVKSTDALSFDASGNFIGASGNSTATDAVFDTINQRYFLGLGAKDGALTSITTNPILEKVRVP